MQTLLEPRRPRFFRRRFLVDPPLQWSLVLHAQLLAVFLMVCVVGGLLWPLVNGVRGDSDSVSGVDAATTLLHLHANLWWIALVTLVLPALASIRLSHRIAGPLVRVRRALRQLAAGSLPAPFRTRRTDYLRPEVAMLDEALTRLATDLGVLRSQQRTLRAALDAIARGAAAGPAYGADPEVAALLERAAAAAAAIGDGLDVLLGDADEADSPSAEPQREALGV